MVSVTTMTICILTFCLKQRILSLTVNVLFMNFKNKLAQKAQTYYVSILVWRQQIRFAMLARCLISSFTCGFLFSNLESVVKSNVTVFVYTKRKQKQLSVQFWSFCLRANGPGNYK